ncbi:uncharacterized protein PITG_12126 [Phytophthora infestans T30-4]|uniref:DDE-1 domain-containing protein n=1 Tax=Phytophthora infestans (strain T30-4) TaxID=403677 RepID=D0NJ38_PHYIT|nr:uncharacterized protein PITG_12126 [Phytophthora infestans T30-4]EEY59556.1 conserved hypothetical protein [Phytophthora infestans T30-4]|eukprot:XP_002900749.1 conserved hypothetical protein [Phytophthora infestans T30-4]
MLIFKNAKSNYPIQGLPDCVNGVCYRTSPSAFINNRIMVEWLRETRSWGPADPFAKERQLWLDNARGHAADRFPFHRIKVHWRNLCERRNMEAIRRGEWMQGAKSSGALANPGKRFFLETAAECIRLVNAEKDEKGVNWAETSMVLCGLDVGNNGKWEANQLSKSLHDIISRCSEDSSTGYQ